MRRLIPKIIALGLLWAGSARAGDQTFTFDTNPTNDPGFIIYGQHLANCWTETNGDPGGYVAITDSISDPSTGTQGGGQNLVMVFPDVDLFTNADQSVVSLPIKAFTIDADLRVGNGTLRPADGFSISFTRPQDQVLINATNNNHNGSVAGTGFAGGDDDYMNNPPTASTAENGCRNGLSILFDAWEGNELPWHDGLGALPFNPADVATNCNSSGGTHLGDTITRCSNDKEGISVRLDDITLIQVGAYTNGAPDRNGTCDDYNSMQTGPNDTTGLPDPLCWAPLHVELSTNKQVTVIWKNHTLLDHYQLANYPTSRGRLVLAGRTGGSWQNVHIDNIHIVTIPDVNATFNGVSAVGLNGFAVTFQSTGPAIVTNFSTITLDGTAVPVSSFTWATNGSAGQFTVGSYTQAARFNSGTTHSVSGTGKTAANGTVDFNGTFTVPNWLTVPTNNVLPLANVNTRGFAVKSWQNIWLQPQPNANYWTDEQLQGYHGPNFSDQSQAVNGEFTWPIGGATTGNSALDFSSQGQNGGGNGDNGFLTSAAGTGYDYGFDNFGLISLQCTNFAGTQVGDNLSLEFNAYIYFPTTGVYQSYFNSDDGFRVTVGGNSREHIGTTIMEFSGGRGVGSGAGSGTAQQFIIDQAGAYPMRIIYENGGGGFGCEWYFQYGTNYILINDDGNGNPARQSPVLAFQNATAGTTPYVKAALPVRDAQNVPLDQSISVDLGDGSSTVVLGTVAFKLDGSPVAVTPTKTGDTTHFGYTNLALWAQGSVHTSTVTYQDNGGKTYTNQWTWTVENNSGFPITQIPASWGIPTSQIDHSRPGVRVRSHEILDNADGSNPQPNTIQWTEEQFMGLHGANIADQSQMTNNGYMLWSEVVDFSGSTNGVSTTRRGTGDGGFPYNFLLNNIGIPSNPNDTNNFEPDYCAGEFGTWIEFPAAGIYTFEVSSDDGFKISSSGRKDPLDQQGRAISWFNGGRGTSGTYNGTKADIYIPAAGAYPFRLLWENGGGGAGVEWVIWQHLPDGSYQALLLGETNVPGAIKSYAFALTEAPRIAGTSPAGDYAGRIGSYRHDGPGGGASLGHAQAFTVLLQAGTAAFNSGSVVLTTGNGTVIPVTVTPAGSNNLYIVTYTPDANNPATWWPSGGSSVTLTYSDAAGSYTNVINIATEFYGNLANGSALGSGDPNKTGFLVRIVQADQLGGSSIANRAAVAEQILAGEYGPNVINVASNLYYGAPVNGYFTISGNSPSNGVINLDIPNSSDGDFKAPAYPENPFPGLPGNGTLAAHHTDSVAAEILTYVEFPTNGIYTMGISSDDGFRVTKGHNAPANNNSLIINTPAQLAGTYLAVPGSYLGTRQLTTPVSGQVVQALGVGGGVEATTRPGVPKEACPPLVNGGALAGNIALIYRGTCNSYEKLQAAKDAGAIGAIIVQNRPKISPGDGWFPREEGGDPQVDIPTLEIGQTNGDLIVAILATNNVTATLTPLDNNENPTAANTPIGGADYGKGANDVTFTVNVQNAGVYPLRAMWWNGGGGCNVEWWSMVGGQKVLINDNASTNGPALKAFTALTGQVLPTISQTYNSANHTVTITFTGTLLQSTDLKTWSSLGTTSPQTLPATQAHQFFRAQQ